MLTQERLKELLHYDPETGVFTWLIEVRCGEYKSRANVTPGQIAGYRGRDGRSEYIWIRADKTLYGAHRLAWLYVYGSLPALIDHINRIGVDNRIANLRLADKSQNAMNCDAPSTNTSGVRGVYFDRSHSRWAAEIVHRGKKHRLGRFKTIEDAALARNSKAKELFGEFARQ